MNSESTKNPVLDVRKELEAQAEMLKGKARSNCQHPGHKDRAEVYLECAQKLYALLQRIPEGWEMRPREPSDEMAYKGCEGHMPWSSGTNVLAIKEAWRTMWDAAKAEADDE